MNIMVGIRGDTLTVVPENTKWLQAKQDDGTIIISIGGEHVRLTNEDAIAFGEQLVELVQIQQKSHAPHHMLRPVLPADTSPHRRAVPRRMDMRRTLADNQQAVATAVLQGKAGAEP